MYNVLQDGREIQRTVTQHHWKSEAKEDYQLSTGGTLATDKSSVPNKLKWIALSRGHHRVWRPMYRCAIKECSKAINRDLVNNWACRLSHYIEIIPNTFVTPYYFSKRRQKSVIPLIFLNMYTKPPKNLVAKGLVVKVILTRHKIL